MKKNKNTKSGFTLIELLIAMGIIAFLIAASVTYFTNFNDRQAINIAYDDLHTALAQAKSYAQSQVVSDCNVSIDAAEKASGVVADEFVGYEVRFDTATEPNTYSIYEICWENGVPGNIKTQVNGVDILPVSTYKLPSKVTFQGTLANVRFNVITGNATPQTITINADDQVRAIRIDSHGVIENASP